MAFRSLSAVINTKIVQAQNAAMASIRLSSSTMNNMGAVRANGQILTSFYKPKN